MRRTMLLRSDKPDGPGDRTFRERVGWRIFGWLRVPFHVNGIREYIALDVIVPLLQAEIAKVRRQRADTHRMLLDLQDRVTTLEADDGG